MKTNNDVCPYCKKKSTGFVGSSIYFNCGGKKGAFYSCERCKSEWKELTKEIVIKRVKLK